jgi:hypothetical protein
MSNKLTRKSLAFGAMVALASSVIAGAPAQAAGEIIVAPTAGTTYTTFSTETFTVATSFAPGVTPASYGQLKYEVASSAAIRTGAGTAATTALAIAGATLADTPLTSGKAVVTPGTAGAATDVRVLAVAIGTVATPAAATTATQTVTVTAFVDSNNDGALTAGEWSAAQTITFKKYSEIVPTVALTPVLAGDLALKATATYPSDVNTAMLTASDFKVVFTAAGATGVEVAGVAATSGVYSDAVTGVAAAAAVTAQATYKTVALGTAVTGTAAAATVATVTSELVEGANAKLIGSPTAVATARLNGAFEVKTTLRGAIPSGGTVGPVVANKAVTLVVTGAGTLTASRTLSINGTVYNNVTALPASIALTSDANGVVTVAVKSADFIVADADLVFTFTSDNISTAASVVTVDQVATVLTISADNGNLYSTALGTSQAVALSVKDQFGTLSAATADRLVVTPTVGSGLTTYGTPAVVALPLVGGKATYTAASGAATTAGTLNLSVALETLNTGTQNYAAASPAVAALTPVAVNFTTTANSFTTAPAATATAKVTADAFTTSIASAAAYRADYTVVVANEGTAVTVAAPGAYIKVGTTFGLGTATANTPAGGSIAVVVYFQKVGATTVTFTNGVAVKTSVVTVTTDLTPALVSLVAPRQAQVGQAMDVVINVTDKWGNPVPTPTTGTGVLSVSSTGTGYFASAAPVANAAGKATVKYIVGTADIGTAYLSAALASVTGGTDSESVEFGLTDGDVLAGGKRIFVSAEFAKGRTVSVSVNGKRIYSKVQTTDNAVELAFTQRRAGTYTVTVRISGGIVFTEKVRVN